VDLDITIADTASGRDTAELRKALHAHNCAVTGYLDGSARSCFLHDGEGTLVADIDGYTLGGYAFIDSLSVCEPLRGSGVGRRLFEAAETEARARGRRTIVLTTHTFQAPAFYSRFGYTTVGATTETPAGYEELLLQKFL
jgi:GNAT superfamily N-acetyltransferase